MLKKFASLDEPFCVDTIQEEKSIAIVGDVHGCLEELKALVQKISTIYIDVPRFIFVGDLVDRGKYNLETVKYAFDLAQKTGGYIIIGNHDRKLIKYCLGHDIPIFEEQEWMYTLSKQDKEDILELFEHVPSAVRVSRRFNDKKLIIAHAAASENLLNFNFGWMPGGGEWFLKKSDVSICYWGHTNGERDEEDFPVRIHMPCEDPDTTCIFGHITHNKDHSISRNEPGTTIYIDHGGVFGYYLSAALFIPRLTEPLIISVECQEYVPDDPVKAKKLQLI